MSIFMKLQVVFEKVKKVKKKNSKKNTILKSMPKFLEEKI